MRVRARGPRPGHGRQRALAAVLVFVAGAVAGEEVSAPKAREPLAALAAAKIPVPPGLMLSESEKQLKELFKDEEQTKKTPAERAELARNFLKAGRENRDDLALQYVALRKAKDLAAAAGDLETAFAAIETLADCFALDGADLKTGALIAAGRAADRPEEVEKALNTGLEILDQFAKNFQYDAALKLVGPFDELARRARNVDLVKTVQTRALDLRKQQAEWTKAKTQFEKLKDNPDDPDAAFAVARFYAAARSDWPRALPLLFKCSVPTLKTAAAKELAQPKDAAAKAELGNIWWALSEKENGSFKEALQAHAASWYLQAPGELSGNRKQRAEQGAPPAASASAAGANAASAYKDGLIRSIPVEDSGGGIFFVPPNGRQFLTVGETGLHLYDLESGKLLKSLNTTGPARMCAFSADGRHLVAAGNWGGPRFGEAAVWDLATGAEEGHYKAGRFVITAVTFYPDGHAVLLGRHPDEDISKVFRVQDALPTGVKVVWGYEFAAWSSDSSLLMLVRPTYRRSAGWIKLFDGRTCNYMRDARDVGGYAGLAHCGFSRDARMVFIAGDGLENQHGLSIFDTVTGKVLQRIELEVDKDRGRFEGFVLFPDNRRIAAGSSSGKVLIWDVASKKLLETLEAEADMSHLDISPDGRFLIVAGNKTVQLFGVAH